ncbi:hypothetical protein [Bordetella tumulicola]|uniref:hypothetical protein n=1 Tax=Bordetella tumulicola TaxID=1649133 RepID=UPI0039F0D984
MSTATLASDSAISLPSRLPAWMPRIVARAAGGVLRQPAKWPFSSGLSQGRRYVPTQSDVTISPVAAQPVVGRPVATQPVVDQPVGGIAHVSVSAASVSIDMSAAHSQSMGTAARALNQGVTARQMVVDVLLVAMWGALIPGMMWLGAAAGF